MSQAFQWNLLFQYCFFIGIIDRGPLKYNNEDRRDIVRMNNIFSYELFYYSEKLCIFNKIIDRCYGVFGM